MNRSLTLILLLALAAPALSSDWYQWRGPEQTGVSREKNLPESWSFDGENLLWKTEAGGMSSPIVMGGKVYAITRVGEEPAPDTVVPGPRTQEAVVCLDAQTGRKLWEHRENPTQTEVPFHRLGWSNVVGDPSTGRIYAQFVDCTLVCLDAASGKPLWQRQMTEEFGMISTYGGRTPSPAIDEDQIFVIGVSFGWGDHGRSQHRIFCLDKNTGELRWSAGTGGIPVDSPYNTPVIAVIGGQRLVIFGAGDGGIHAFQARTGKPAWGTKISKRGINASVVVEGDRVFACHSEENLADSTMGAVVCIDGNNGKVVWNKEGVEAGFASPVVVDGKLYVLDNKAMALCFDTLDGKQLWRKSTGTIGKASLVWGDGKLYIAEANGRVTILKPGASKAEVLSKVEVPMEKYGREFAIFGSVAIANGRIYLQTERLILCIGPSNPTVVADPIPPAPQESAPEPGAKVAQVQVRPADAVLSAGEKLQLKAFGYDAQGRPLGEVKASWSIGQVDAPLPPNSPPGTKPAKIGNLKGTVDAAGAFVAESGVHQAGAIAATAGDATGVARVRVLPPLPWKFDFESSPVAKPPLTWLGAGGKFAVQELEGNKVLTKLTNFDLYYRASTNFGSAHMSNYTIQSDVRVGQKTINGQRQMPDPGVINTQYMLLLLGNHQRLQIQVWAPTIPYSLNKTIDYAWEPDTWYTMKLRVDQQADKAVVRGKVWRKGQPEPSDWTVTLEDALPNREGNPGLFGHSLVSAAKSEIYYDNIEVTDNK